MSDNNPYSARRIINALWHVAVALQAIIVSSAQAAEPERGRCYQQRCAWSRTLSQNFLGSNNRGVLISVLHLGGESTYTDLHNLARARITWQSTPFTTYVFCSKVLPAVMLFESQPAQVDLLILPDIEKNPGIMDSSVSFYMNVCHRISNSPSQKDLENMGYSKSLTDKEIEVIQQEIHAPLDILVAPLQPQ